MSTVLRFIAERYRARRAGRRNNAVRPLTFRFHDLLKEAQCLTGPKRFEAIRDIELMEKSQILVVTRHRTDVSEILEIRLPLTAAGALFDYLGESAPQKDRDSLAQLFQEASSSSVPIVSRSGWKKFCEELALAAEVGGSIHPFERSKRRQTELILKALPALLAWEGESLMRFASTSVFGHSKLLEAYQSPVETCLSRISDGRISKLTDLGILENERSFLIHGPIQLIYETGRIDLECLECPARLGVKDIRRAQAVTSAQCCVAVENAAMLMELAKLRSGHILVSSGSEGGYANSATVEFLDSLPSTIQLFHFGDSDPKGFDILRDLRNRLKKNIQSLHMYFRPADVPVPLTADDLETMRRLLDSDVLLNSEKDEIKKMGEAESKGRFEQESLGRPEKRWPFYRILD